MVENIIDYVGEQRFCES